MTQARGDEGSRPPLLIEERAQVRVAAAVTRAAKDVDRDLACGTANAEAVAAVAGADEGL